MTASFNVRYTVNKAAGAAVNSVPVARKVTEKTVEVLPIQITGLNPGGQVVEYAITTSTATSLSAPLEASLTWKTFEKTNPSDPDIPVIFTELSPGVPLLPLTNYYVWARTERSDDCNSGAARRSAVIHTAAPAKGITLNRTAAFNFPAAAYGYASRPTLHVIVNNIGTDVTGALTAEFINTLPGDMHEGFVISTSAAPASTVTLGSIPVNGQHQFTIRPADGLDAGTYAATFRVSSAEVTERTFRVSFTVNKVAGVGAAVSGVPVVRPNPVLPPATTGITISALDVPFNHPLLKDRQVIEYAISTTTAIPPAQTAGVDNWITPSVIAPGDPITFTELRDGVPLLPNTQYYVFARTKLNTNYNAGAVQRSLPIHTNHTTG